MSTPDSGTTLRTAEAATDAVRRYYRLVDRRDIDGLVSLFSPDAVYARPGYPALRGRDQIRAFYQEERVIARGDHTLSCVVAEPDRVAVHGQFSGVLRDGREVQLRFADFFLLDAEGRFAQRDTFFFAPLV